MGRRERFFEILTGARARRGVALMGICNVTPDSFSDGGRHFAREDAFARVRQILDEGGDFVDVGGESTRPGAQPVPPAEQLARVLDVVKYAVKEGGCVSIDTTSPEVAAACLDAGACAVNDVSCLRDEGIASACASHDAALILMHSREPMAEMLGFSKYPDEAYGDVVRDVVAEWRFAADRAEARGVPRKAVVMDPGLGFAKNARHSRTLLAATGTIAKAVGVPVLVGASRKSFLAAAVDPPAKPAERDGASIAAALFAARHDAAIVRVHDVRGTRQALDLERMLGEGAR